MADQYGNVLKAPGTSSKARINDPELLYSYNPPPTKKGCTLQPGQGVLVIGTPLKQLTDGTKQFVACAATDASMQGFLVTGVDTGVSTDIPHQANIFLGGVLKYGLIKAALANTDISAAALTALGAHVNTTYGFLKF